jgi:hypothetical protein
VENLKRRIAKERPNELGEDGEFNLHQMLTQEFASRGDDIVDRVGKFRSGPDIIHRVIEGGTHIGTLIYDSKNTSTFQSKWVAKLVGDRKLADADHAVLVSSVLPPNTSQMTLVDDVVVALPARTLVLAHLLRQQIVRDARHKLSMKGRSQKAARIYAFLTSNEGTAMWDRYAREIEALVRIEQADRKHQDKTRTDRLQRIETLRRIVHDEFLAEVNRLIGGAA